MQAISLFSNCGAGDFGYRQAGFRFRVMAELDPRRMKVAALNHPEASVVWGNLRETWPTVVEAWRNAVEPGHAPDLLAACPPCQGLSSARSDRGREADADAGSRDHRNLLVEVIAAVAHELEPRAIVVENVPAFLTRAVRHPDTGEPISAAKLLIGRLSAEYTVFPLLTDLVDYGVPQSRVRSFVTFLRNDELSLEMLRHAAASPYPIPAHAQDHGGDGGVVLQQALASFQVPALDASMAKSGRDPERPLHFVPVWKDRRYEIVAAIPPNSGGSAWENGCGNCNDVVAGADDIRCPACGDVLPRPAVFEEGDWRLVKGFRASSYRRMDPAKPAATVTTASGNLGSDRTVHPWENRVLSPLECALLQTFPQDFRWGTALDDWGATSVRRMIGEAVPPLFTEQHGAALVALLTEDHVFELLSVGDPRCRRAQKRLKRGARGSRRNAGNEKTE